jgi:hypothetical protein
MLEFYAFYKQFRRERVKVVNQFSLVGKTAERYGECKG